MPWRNVERRKAVTARYRKTDKYKQRMSAWRSKNRETVREYSRRRRAKIRDLIRSLKDVPCADCGGRFDPVCMDFDHRPGEKKLFTIGGSVRLTYASLQTEVLKCDVVCANCHRIRTYKRRDHSALIRSRRP